MSQISTALNLKAQFKNPDRFNTGGGGFLAVKWQLLLYLQCTWCLFSRPKEREGWKCSSGFAQTALILCMKEYIALKHWEVPAESGLLHVLGACAVLNCSAVFREELHLLCQSSLSRCSCMEEATLHVAGRVHPAGGKHCPFLAAMGRMRGKKDCSWEVGLGLGVPCSPVRWSYWCCGSSVRDM